ncbi:MAG: hypothetical protein ABH824_01240 [Nanoarchaeota archaeon]|nr:hypothetical protein [Nanoarchaeota archaeon]
MKVGEIIKKRVKKKVKESDKFIFFAKSNKIRIQKIAIIGGIKKIICLGIVESNKVSGLY